MGNRKFFKLIEAYRKYTLKQAADRVEKAYRKDCGECDRCGRDPCPYVENVRDAIMGEEVKK